jgi:hypothetical protein
MTDTIKLTTFLDNFEIPYLPIYYFLFTKEDGTVVKKPIGEMNNLTIETIENKKEIYKTKEFKIPTSYKVSKTDYRPLTNEEKKTLVLVNSLYLKYTGFYCIDLDDKTIKCLDDYIKILKENKVEKSIIKIIKSLPWTTGNTKGIHIYIRTDNVPIYANQLDVLNFLKGDFLRKTNVWEKVDKEINNYNSDYFDTPINFDLISPLFKNGLKEIEEKPKEKKIIKEDTKEDIKEDTKEDKNNDNECYKYLNHLFKYNIYEKIGNYNNWLSIGILIKNEKLGFELFNKISELMPKYDGYNECKNFYDNLNKTIFNNTKKQITIASIKYILKKSIDDETLYKKINKEFINNNNNNSNLIFVKDDNEASDYLINIIGDNFIYTRKVLYYKKNNKYIYDKSEIYNNLISYILGLKIFKTNEKNETLIYCGNIKGAKNIYDAFMAKILTLKQDDNFYNKFHSSTKNKLCFLDGVLDFKERKFTKWENVENIYTTIIINFNYEEYFNKPNKEFINTIKKTIFENLFNDKTDLVLKYFSRAITANIEDKNFMSFMGNRNCGKGILYLLFKTGFEDYVNSFNLENMLCDRQSKKSSDMAKENGWLMDFQYCRIGISQETEETEKDITKQKKISNKVIKSIASGGDIIECRSLYNDKIKINIDTSIIILGNNSIVFDGNDNEEHHIRCEGVKQFISQDKYNSLLLKYGEKFMSAYSIKKDDLKQVIYENEDYKFGIIYLLYEYYENKALEINNKKILIDFDFKIITDDDEDNNISVRELIFENYIITKDKSDRIIKTDLYELLDFDKKKINAELKELGCVNNALKTKDEKDETRNGKACFINIKKK